MDMHEREKVLAKVEELMAKGFSEPAYIARTLDLTWQMADEYVKAIRVRWKATKIDREELRNELISNAKMIMKQLWIDRQTFTQENSRLGSCNAALKANERLAKLLGLDIDVTANEKQSLEGFFNEFAEDIKQKDDSPEDGVGTEQVAENCDGEQCQVQDDSSR